VAIELLPVHRRDREAVVSLFAAYPFKAWQKKAQGIAPLRLAQLLWDMAEPQFERPATSAWVAWEKRSGEALGFAMMSPHPWHSEIFGRRMGRITHFVNYREPSEVGPVLLGRLLEDARRLGIEHLACRIDGSDWPNVHLLESRGFVCVDCSLKMGRTLNDLPENARPSTSPVRVRAYEPTDLEAMQRIAARSHIHNHFYNDPWLERTRSAALFSEWLRRCAAGAAEFILVAEDEDGKVTGFVTALANKALARVVGVAVGIIDYIVVDRDAEGRGIGRALLDAALARLASDNRLVELRTSHDNYRAVAFYNAAGFRLLATDFVFHRLESEPGKGTETRR